MLILFDLLCISFVLALLLTPAVRALGLKLGWVDKPDNGRKIHQFAVPRVGGIAVAAAYSITCLLVLVLPYRNVDVIWSSNLPKAIGLIPAAAIIFAVGLLDDIFGLKPWQKLIGQVIASVMAYSSGFGIYNFQGYALPWGLGLVISVFWLVLCSNAFNLIDGMDGLAAGVGLFATLTTLIAALVGHSLDLAIVTIPLVGALLGFLKYNFNPASIFLGDCGSLLVGFLLGCFGATWSQKSATLLGMTAPLMAMAVPLLDTLLAVVRRAVRDKAIFGADRRHIHHQLLSQGLNTRRSLLLVYGVSLICAVFSLLATIADRNYGGLIVLIFCVGAWIGIQHLGYAEFSVAGRLLSRGSLRGMIDIQFRLREFDVALAASTSIDQMWGILSAASKDFGFNGLRLKIGDEIREERAASMEGEPDLQIRVPLPDGQYANFYCSLQAHLHPVVMGSFAETVSNVLSNKIRDLEHPASAGDGASLLSA